MVDVPSQGAGKRAGEHQPAEQQVDYVIRATLDTAAKRIDGSESIRYTNKSPDSLRFVWLQLDQNLFRPGSAGSRPRGEPGLVRAPGDATARRA
jgi:hypothetical protein